MRVRVFLEITFALTAFLLLTQDPCFPQSITNISFQQTPDNKIRVSYYLSSPESQDFQIDIFASTDGGRSFIETESVSGDVGHVSGSGWKNATWDVLKDAAQFIGSNCEFRVQATEIKSLGDAIGTFYTMDRFIYSICKVKCGR